MSSEKSLGLKFKLFGYKIRIWRNGWEYEKNGFGKAYFFWWHPKGWRYK